MIEFSDLTLREAEGSFEKVKKLMKQDNAPKIWMLQSKVFVDTEIISSSFLINFWNDGRVIISEVFRPISLEVPNDDIIELSRWTEEAGWKKPEPSSKFLNSPRTFDFWERQYQSGLIVCQLIDERESDLIDRVKDSEEKEEKDD